MKALYWDGSGALEWRQDAEPAIAVPTDALVRPVAVSTCDLDQAIIHASTPVPGSGQPFAIGHEGVEEVLEIGEDYGGLFCELIRVPYANYSLVRLPPTVSAVEAVSAGDNLTDAWRTVAPQLTRRPGLSVLILSAGSIGRYAADIARASGAGLIRYVDADPARRSLAGRLGASACAPEEFDPREHLFAVTVNATDDAAGGALRASSPSTSATRSPARPDA